MSKIWIDDTSRGPEVVERRVRRKESLGVILHDGEVHDLVSGLIKYEHRRVWVLRAPDGLYRPSGSEYGPYKLLEGEALEYGEPFEGGTMVHQNDWTRPHPSLYVLDGHRMFVKHEGEYLEVDPDAASL